MPHRKARVLMAVSLLLPMITLNCSANSLPVIWEGKPGYESLTFEPDNAISVEHELLQIYLSSNRKEKIKVQYTMRNTASSEKFVDMIFPFRMVEDFDSGTVSITADGIPVPFTIYPVDHCTLDNDMLDLQCLEKSLDFRAIRDTMEHTMGTAYRYAFDTSLENLYVKMKSPPRPNCRIFGDIRAVDVGPGGMTIDAGDRINPLSDANSMVFFVFDPEPLDFEISGYLDGSMKMETTDFSYSSAEIKSVSLLDFIAENEDAINDCCETQLISRDDLQQYNIFLSHVAGRLGQSDFVSFFDLLWNTWSNGPYTQCFSYRMDFQPSAAKVLCIEYQTQSEKNKENKLFPEYQCTYFLSPAKLWQDYNELDIEIHAPFMNPDILSSSLPLARKGPLTYAFNQGELPDSELIFTFGKGKWFWCGVIFVVAALILLIGYLINGKRRDR